ncbi:MAG TPA: TonB-dependent receptor [Thermoanaerobaculia bacterium]|nr:TonB-dependent receptor [Thermoanaerobaculia bacterium]
MKRFTYFAALLLLLVASVAQAQTTATLTGSVTHEGNPLPGATVTINSPNMQGTRVAYTDVNGNYNFPALPAGQYTVVISMEGMGTVTRTARIGVAQTGRVDANLSLSAVAEAITVTARAEVVENTEIQTNIQADLIEDLPIGRTVIATVNLAPGVNNSGPGGNTMISGAPSYDSVYYIDGAAVNENLRGQPQDLFIEDAIQETTVLTGGISAEYGRFTGGVVNTITKSGGNEFSGSLRDSFTNSGWRENYPNEATVPETDTTQTYEATLGGYLMRDRLWFFGAGRYFETESVEYLARSTQFFVPNSEEETRLEGKLTGQITPNHSLVGTLLTIENPQLQTFGTPAEASALDQRNVDEKYWSGIYNGILTNNFLVQALYAKKDLTFVDSGGGPAGPPGSRENFVNATNVYLPRWGAYAGAPTFGNSLGDKVRASENYTLKGTYYLSTGRLGTHNIVGGYDNYVEKTNENNNQSGSDFTVYTYATPSYDANGNLRIGMPNTGTSGFIIYWPILVESQTSAFETQSLFINDKWDLTNKLSFNLGLRYDANDGADQSGATIADDSKFSPRLGATYDIFGNGRLRATATYGEYVSKIAGGNVGDGASPAGQPSILYWLYRGPAIAPTDTRDMLGKVWDWFQSIGGLENRGSVFLGGAANGYGSQVKGGLISPSVTEYTVGLGGQLGPNGFFRADYQNREWSNFYVSELTLDNPYVEDPLVGGDVQVEFLTNSSGDVVREYDAIILQGGYRLFNRLNVGLNYTWSELTGNYEGETSGSGPVTEAGARYQPELINYSRRDPIGIVSFDRTHKMNAWASYDLPTPIGNFNFSALQRFESGAPYSIAGTINLADCTTCRENPGYQFPETEAGYFFSDRGEFRLDNWTATDFAIGYSLPIRVAQLFVQGELFNAFNEDQITSINTTVYTANDAQCPQCETFDPFTVTPVEGVHYIKGPQFGQALANSYYQTPRSWRFSVGLRF